MLMIMSRKVLRMPFTPLRAFLIASPIFVKPSLTFSMMFAIPPNAALRVPVIRPETEFKTLVNVPLRVSSNGMTAP